MDEPGPSNVRVLTREYIFEMMQDEELLDFNQKLDFVETKLLGSDKFSEVQINEIKHKFSYFKSEMKRRWKAAHYILDKFLAKNHAWLQGTFEMPKINPRLGRPTKNFGDSSERSKRRKTEELRELDVKKLTHATQSKLYKEGKRDASHVLKYLCASPKRASKYKKAFIKEDNVKTLTAFEALTMMVEADLTRRQYEIIRDTNKKLYPCYSLIQKAKAECYPEKDAYKISETCAEVKLEALLRHTNKRLILSLSSVLNTLSDAEKQDQTLISKWGCDGSQQTQFRQKFSNEADSDKYIFQSSLVPLRLICNINKKVLWQNPTPSSPRFCRPMRIRFLKESTEITNEEISYVNKAISEMPEYLTLRVDNTEFKIKQSLLLTMVDGKVCNAATDTKSTLRCYICKETSSMFNNLNDEEKIIDKESLKFGLSILHARIRIFESLLHLAYKLPLKKGRIQQKNRQETELFEQTKKEIQQKFKLQMGLLVDIPKAGFGNTNDGNTSRRFFEDPEVASKITGIDRDLIYRLKVILEAISSGFDIDIQKFSEYSMDTAKLYVNLYGWCPMTPTMHKLLVHGATIIKHALLPIGQLSEEAAEARNKHFKLYRQNFARKFSREACNLDVFNRLLLSSDPLISSSRPKRNKRSKPFLPETKSLFKPELIETEDSNSEEEEEELEEF